MNLDIQTLLVMTLVNLSVAAIAAAFLWISIRPIRGLGMIAAGVGCISFGFIAELLKGPMLGRSALLVDHVVSIVGTFLILNGVREFRGLLKLSFRKAACLYGLFLSIWLYFLYAQDNTAVRTAIASTLGASLCIESAWTMASRSPRNDRFIYFSASAGLGFYGLIEIFRGLCAVTSSQGTNTFRSGFLPVLCFIVLNACVTGSLFALSAAANRKLRKQIEDLALCDPLTGLPNRRSFDRHLDRIHTHSIATNSPVALLYIDVDRFKDINDRFGHDAGDLALKSLADRLRGVTHAADCLARMGGDEFVILTQRFPSRISALGLIETLQNTLIAPVPISGTPVRLSISCGLAFYPEDVDDTADLVREADSKMYITKRRMPMLR